MLNDSSHLQPSILASEAARIREVFGRRTEPGDGPLDLFRFCVQQERQEGLVLFFRKIGLTSLKGLRVLDVGCGSGGQLRRFTDFGVEPEDCIGIDLFHPGLAAARRKNPNIFFIEGNATQLPLASGQFDLVFQYTVFTSILDAQIRRGIASEIHRVLRPGGYLIWYDFVYSNPKNPNVRGIGSGEIRELLSGFRLRFRRITLAPPIGRRVAKISPSLYRALAAIPLLRSHYMCFAQKF